MADPTGKAPIDDTNTPRWVKTFGIAALVVIALVVVLLLTGDGRHGPSRHTGSNDSASPTPNAGRK
jgi:hypothetical protein